MQFPKKWKRPTNVPFPNVWSKFTSKPMNGKTYEIRIQDATPDRHEEIVDMMCKYYLRDEPLFASLRIFEHEPSVLKSQRLFHEVLRNNASLIAVLDNNDPTPEIFATQLFYVSSKQNGDFSHSETKEEHDVLFKIDQLYNRLRENIDPFQLFQGNEYFDDLGLCVKPEYRGLRIGHQIFSCLEKLAVAFNVPGCMLTATSIQSQIIAERAGLIVYNEIFYDQYKDEKGNVIFPIKSSNSVKLLGKKYDNFAYKI